MGLGDFVVRFQIGLLFFIRHYWRRVKLDSSVFLWTKIPQIVAIQFNSTQINSYQSMWYVLSAVWILGEHDALSNLGLADCCSYFRYFRVMASRHLPSKTGMQTRYYYNEFTRKISYSNGNYLNYILQAKLDKCTKFHLLAADLR